MANEVTITINARDNATAALNSVKASTIALGSSVGILAAEMAKNFAGMAGDAIRSGISFNAMKEQAQIAFTTMLGSGEKAKAFLDELQSFAAKTPFEFPDLLKASQRLQAMGFESEQVIPLMTSIGDAVAGLGGGSAEIDRAVIALGQLQARGKTTAQEMNQLTELGIPAWAALAEAIGKPIPEAMKLVEKGAIDAQTTIAAVTQAMNRDFGGMMDQQSRTWNGMISTIKDNARILAGEVAAPLFEQLKGTMAAFMGWFEQNRAQISEVAKGIGMAIAAIADVVLDTVRFIVRHWGTIGPALQAIWEISGMAAIVRVIKSLNEMRDSWRTVANDIIGVVEGMVNQVIRALNVMVDAVGDALEGIRNAANTVLPGDPFGTGQIFEGGGIGEVALPGVSDPNKWAVPMPPKEDALANTAKASRVAIDDLSASIGAGTSAAKGMSEAEKELEDARREMQSVLADITRTQLDEQITAYYEGGQAQLDAVKETQAKMMEQVRERTAELQQKWGLEFPDALNRAFAMVKSGIDSVTEAARRMQEFGLSYLQSLGQRNVKFAPGVFADIARATGLNGFAEGGIVPGNGPQLAIVHGGERVLTPEQQIGGVHITANFYGPVTDADAGSRLVELINQAIRRDGPQLLPGAVMS